MLNLKPNIPLVAGFILSNIFIQCYGIALTEEKYPECPRKNRLDMTALIYINVFNSFGSIYYMCYIISANWYEISGILLGMDVTQVITAAISYREDCPETSTMFLVYYGALIVPAIFTVCMILDVYIKYRKQPEQIPVNDHV